jgi:hypothetical protein
MISGWEIQCVLSGAGEDRSSLRDWNHSLRFSQR